MISGMVAVRLLHELGCREIFFLTNADKERAEGKLPLVWLAVNVHQRDSRDDQSMSSSNRVFMMQLQDGLGQTLSC